MELPENKLVHLIQGNEREKWSQGNNHDIKNFTEDEIKWLTKNYSTPIGEGAFGKVYRGDLDEVSPVAVKILKSHMSLNFKEGFYKEITIHRKINHKNVVKFLGYCSEENALMMVTEYISGGNLKDLLHCRDDPISLDTRLAIAIDCAEALRYMHSYMYQPIIHGDIKPDNILLDGNLGAKLSDFGISRLLSTDGTQYTMHVAGSRGYMDPEHIETGRVDPKSDVYSFGVVLVELVTRAKVSENGISTGLIRNFTQAIEKGKKAREMFDIKIADVSNIKVLDKIGKLAAECLRKDIKKRPAMKDVAERLQMLRKAYCQQGQEKVSQWTLWGIQGTGTEKVKQDATISSSNSIVVDKLNSLDISGSNANMTSARNKIIKCAPPLEHDPMDDSRNFMRNAAPRLPHNVNIFTKAELRKITNNYSVLIGNGSSGATYKGTLEDKTPVAVKRCITVDKIVLPYTAIIYSGIVHKNIIKLWGLCLEADVPMLVYEFAANGGLQDILHGNYNVPLGLRLDIAVGCAEALAYFHSESLSLMYGNVKSADILLDENLVPKVSGNLPSSSDINTSSDNVYSFGTILLELITRKQAGYGDNDSLRNEFIKAYEKEKSGKAMFDKEIAVNEGDIGILEEIGRLAMQCLQKNVDARPKMTAVAKRLRKFTRAWKHGHTNISGAQGLSRSGNLLEILNDDLMEELGYIYRGGKLSQNCCSVHIFHLCIPVPNWVHRLLVCQVRYSSFKIMENDRPSESLRHEMYHLASYGMYMHVNE